MRYGLYKSLQHSCFRINPIWLTSNSTLVNYPANGIKHYRATLESALQSYLSSSRQHIHPRARQAQGLQRCRMSTNYSVLHHSLLPLNHLLAYVELVTYNVPAVAFSHNRTNVYTAFQSESSTSGRFSHDKGIPATSLPTRFTRASIVRVLHNYVGTVHL